MLFWLTAAVLAGFAALHFAWRRQYGILKGRLAAGEQSRDTARKEYTRESSQRQAEQQALFNSMAEGVLVLDRAGRVQLVNQSLQRLFSLSNDVRGFTIMQAFRLQELLEITRRLEQEQTVRGCEFQLPGLGDPRWLEVNAAVMLDPAGTFHGSILVFHELTRLKQLENTRQEFVANVSHELRTPLSLIKGYVETLIDGAKNDPETSTRFLHTIEKHTDRLTYLIEDLLTISRLESGQIVMNIHEVGLRDEVARVIDDLQSRADEKKVALQNDVPEELSVRADAERLQQVFFNLIENAIKYGRMEGHVVIGGRCDGEEKIEMWVRDDGPGIPAEARERVFERFYRVDRARSRETGGTGLGLAIVKHIIQAHGGEVWVKSELGSGATFFFTLPRA